MENETMPAPGHYYVEENNEDTDETGSASATPFQFSSDMPVIEIEEQRPPRRSATPQTNTRRSLLLKIALIATVLVVASGLLWLIVFAQPAPLTQPGMASTPHPHHTQQALTPTVEPLRPWVPQQFPAGWGSAGLTVGDAIFAERSAWTFTDREEAIDFRDVGTRAQHAGTLTAAAFMLTSGGKMRFAQNDRRVADNVLFDKIETFQLIQAAVNAVPKLTAFTVQDANQLAWVDVSYELFQSQPDLNNPGQRLEGLEMDALTNQPRIHHMSVLLVRVAPGTQGEGAPMGGTGWLVSNYGQDLPVPVVQPV